MFAIVREYIAMLLSVIHGTALDVNPKDSKSPLMNPVSKKKNLKTVPLTKTGMNQGSITRLIIKSLKGILYFQKSNAIKNPIINWK